MRECPLSGLFNGACDVQGHVAHSSCLCKRRLCSCVLLFVHGGIIQHGVYEISPSKVGRVAWRTIIVFVAATTDVIIVCRWRAPSVGHGSRLKVAACFCFDTFLRSMHIDESTIQNIEQYPPRPSGWAVRPVDAFLKVTINKRS